MLKSKDKVAIVTGAGQGIGLAVVKKFVLEGLNVVFVDVNDDLLHQVRNSDFLKDYQPSKRLFLKVNVSNVEAVKNCVKVILEKWGRIDI